jgi:hypothetical protein
VSDCRLRIGQLKFKECLSPTGINTPEARAGFGRDAVPKTLTFQFL